MFAPQQYPGIQAPPYCQYIPNPFMTPQMPTMLPNPPQDNREKRNWSPNTNTSPSTLNEEKRRRNESGDNVIPTSGNTNDLKEPTMLDLKTYMDAIMTRLNTTAAKIDITSINDKITAQNIEIDQLKVRVNKHEEVMKNLQATIDEGVAASLTRKLQSADANSRMSTNNMADPSAGRWQNTTSTRRNLIIEGLQGETEEDMCSNMIRICAAIKITLYKQEIETIVRYTRRDDSSPNPGPVNVTVSRVVLRDTILRKKNGLKDIKSMEHIYINADESFEVRKAKSILRKVAKTVKDLDLPKEIRHDRILLDNIWYTTNDIEKIPAKFMPLSEDEKGATASASLEKPSTHGNLGLSADVTATSKVPTEPGKRNLSTEVKR